MLTNTDNRHRNSIFILLGLCVIFAFAIYMERDIRLKEYHQNITQNLQMHYDEKLTDYSKISALGVKMVEMHIAPIFDQLLHHNNVDNKVLQHEFVELEKLLKGEGISQIRVYSLEGTLLFDTKHLILDEKLLLRINDNAILKNALQTHKITYGYDFDGNFQGLRYVAPIFKNNSILGFVETSIPFDKIIYYLEKTTHVKTHLIYKKDILERNNKEVSGQNALIPMPTNSHYVFDSSHLKIPYWNDISPHFRVHNLNQMILDDGKAFTYWTKNFEINLIVMTPIYNYSQEMVGVLLSVSPDSQSLIITIIQLCKFFIFLLVLYFLYRFYTKSLRNEILLNQYKQAVDASALVSKTDISGKITYVNDSFETLSGYSKKELLGKQHRLIRAPEVPSSLFKEMWDTIKKGEVWQGKVKNKKKNDERYTVNATILPIKDERGVIIEYIAIRYDISQLEAYREILEHRLNNTDQDLQLNIALLQQYQNAIERASSFCRFDAHGVITYVNKTMCLISHLSEKDLLNHSVTELGLINETIFKTICQEVFEGKTWNGVIECQHHTDIKCFLDATFSPIFENETLKEIMCISHDITPLYQLYQEIEDTQKEVVFTMGAIGESRSQETGNHVKRVAEYSKILAKLYGLSAEEAELLKQASPMHDIGKVGIPDAILNKPGKLNEEEWIVMKTHATLGYEMLKHSSRPLLKAASIVAHEHHEKWNGSGYPRGLKGDKIHIYGRITSIADVFDALGSDRCYKKAWELERILDLFKTECGISFDPTLVYLLLDNIDDFLHIKEQFKDSFEEF